MAAKQKRLIKIAKEFNIGHNTIVEFLAKKGFEIESNPNTKVPPECYELLEKEFGDQISVKEKSKAVSQRIKDRRQERADTGHDKTQSTSGEKSVPSGDDEEDKDILIKDNSAQASDSDSAEKSDKTETTGKQKEKTTEPDKEKKETAKAKESDDAAKKDDAAKAEKEEKTGTENQSEDLKIMGKIDLEGMNQKTRPGKKSKKDKKAEKDIQKQEDQVTEKLTKKKTEDKKTEEDKEDKKAEEKETKKDKEKPGETKEEPPSDQKEEQDKSKENFKETEFEKIDGPKVVGRINIENYLQKEKDIEKKRKKDKEAIKAERKKQAAKKKRKRIKKEKVSVKDKEKQQQPGKGKSFSKKKKTRSKAKSDREEITEEDVQKQIKNTLARMETKKQKSKGAKYRRDKREAVSKKLEEEKQKEEEEKNVLQVNEFASVSELASMMDQPVTELISTCMNIGLNVSINQRLDAETMTLVADEFGYDIEFVSADDIEEEEEEEDDIKDMEPRAPIVTVMGHVDHGKTKLLDHIRHSNVVAGEAGKITQHIGAYSVELDDGKMITFLDTPGHEAFTAMRARGTQVTDIAIIVIAADDNVMPQTVEAINHASAAGVPMVFAINKVDKPTADSEKIKEKLANMNYLVEDWGGKYQSQDISALKGENVDELLEKVLLEAELLDLKANPNRPAEGSVIESSLDKGRGYVSTMLVQRGTLQKGDILLAGQCYGRVKAMFNERQKPIKETGPATPAVVLGLNGAPQAGDKFKVMESDSEAKNIAQKRQQLAREQSLRTQKHITLDEIGRRLALGNFQEVNVVVKGDVDGSIEALSDSLIKLSTEELQVNVIHKAVGQITETDVMLASASNAVIIGFQVRPSVNARRIAEKEEIEIRLYSIIYDAINDMKDAMEGMLSPEINEKINGTAEVKEVFKITKVGKIAGCKVVDGKIYRNNKVRVIRDGIVVYTGELGSLKRYKEDVKEVATGYECGLNVANFNDVKAGDVIESFEEVEVKKKLK
ncbi:MAG: translation initiation factor IF-2 [Bacteroidota bacterium]